MIYTVSDTHSFYAPFIEALDEKGFFENEKNKLLLLGDALDRGPDTKRMIEFLLSLHREGRLIYVKGNHEWLFVECLQELSRGKVFEIACGMSPHYLNGTFSTMLEIADMTEVEAVSAPDELVRRVMASDYYNILLPECINYYETEKYVFTHGFIPCDFNDSKECLNLYKYNPEWRNADNLDWHKASWLNGIDMVCKYNISVPDKTIVVGHIRSSYGHTRYNGSTDKNNFSVFSTNGLLAIDACTVKSGKVNCLCFEE